MKRTLHPTLLNVKFGLWLQPVEMTLVLQYVTCLLVTHVTLLRKRAGCLPTRTCTKLQQESFLLDLISIV